MPRIAVFAIAVALLQSGCSGSHYLWSQGDRHYTAVMIRTWEYPPASSKQSTIRVLLVHGMGNFPFGTHPHEPYSPILFCENSYSDLVSNKEIWRADSDKRNALVAKAVKENWKDFIDTAARLLHHRECSAVNYDFRPIPDDDTGEILGYTFTRTFERGPGGVALKFYVVNWGLGAAALKEQRFGNWRELRSAYSVGAGYREVTEFDPKLNSQRAWLNKNLKLLITDWGLGDAALYLSNKREKLIKPVKCALLTLLKDAQENDSDHIAIVTHSLGSTIMLDVIRQLQRTEPELLKPIFKPEPVSAVLPASLSAKRLAKKRADATASSFYMFANQYSLLKIGGYDPLASLAVLRNRYRESPGLPCPPFVQIFAFTDPNDLLSYPLNPKLEGVSICNVFVRNPAVNLGFFYDPLEAHLNYYTNRTILKTMMDGPKDVQLPPPHDFITDVRK